MTVSHLYNSRREVVAVFTSAPQFDGAVEALQSNGVDRARISVLATGKPREGARLIAAGFRTTQDLLDAPNVARTAYVQPADVVTGKGALVSAMIYVGASAGAALAAAAAGPIAALVIAAAIASGTAGGVLGSVLSRRVGSTRRAYVEQSLAHGGLVLWVAAHEDEQRLLDVLGKAFGLNVHAHDVPL